MCAYRRTRNGCLTCKTRKKKCDLGKPACDNCNRLGLECQGYKQRVLWEDDPIRLSIKRRGPRKLQQHGPVSTTANILPPDTDHNGFNTAVKDSTRYASCLGPTSTSEPTFDTLETPFSDIESDCGWIDPFELPNERELPPGSGISKQSMVVATPMMFSSPKVVPLSPLEPLLWDYYVNFFSRSYPTCSDSNNPFLTCLIPIAFQHAPVRQTLLALAALQAKHTYHASVEQEMRRLRRTAFEECRKISDATGGPQLVCFETQPSDRNFGFPGAMILLSDEDKLCLVTTTVLMILFAKLSGAPYESIRAHMDFAREYFVFEETFGSNPVATTQTPLYRFLRTLFSYNDLLASLAVKKPRDGKAPLQIQPPSDPQQRQQKAFTTLFARISEAVGEVSCVEFDQWDGSLDFIPSYSTGSTGHSILPVELSNNNFELDEDVAVREIYRASGRIYYYQKLRDSSATPVQREIDNLATCTIDLIRSLAEDTRYNTALLFPLGIVGPELRSTSHRAFVLSKLDFLHQTLHFDHYSAFSKDLIHAWAKMDLQDEQHPQSSREWLPSKIVRLIG